MGRIRITKGSGVHISFENGYVVSIQFGPGMYGDHHHRDWDDKEKCGEEGSTAVECAVWGRDGNMIAMPQWGGDNVGGYMSIDQMMELLVWAQSQPEGEEK